MAWESCSVSLKEKLRGLSTKEEVTAAMRSFIEFSKEDDFEASGWPSSACSTCYLGVSLFSEMQHKVLISDNSRPDIVVNACCPGRVMTHMSSLKGEKTPDQGADTPLYLALLPPIVKEPRGQFVSDRTI